jgi:hypothetical protein
MKKLFWILSLLSIIIIFASNKLATRLNSEVLSVLGFTKSFADQNILGSVISGYPAFVKPDNLAQIMVMSGDDKAALVKDFCAYIKNYCHSPDFKVKYETYRQLKKPSVPQLSEEEKAYQREAIAQMEAMFTPEALESLPPEARAEALRSVEDMKANVNDELSSDQIASWEEEVPADPNVAIKKGLKKFLEESKDVDFSATTFMKDNRKIFTNQSYEAKPGQWKACYRAGREVSEAGRDFAKEWLAELE